MRDRLEAGLKNLDIDASPSQVQTMLDFLDVLMKWNNTHNLTAITDPVAMIDQHLLDSLSILPFIKGPSLLDVGSGAGFPGVVIAIMRPDIQVSSIDTRGKKIQFLTLASSTLGLENFHPIQSRVEKFVSSVSYAQIISRAFSSLDNFIALTKHLISEGGEWLAMKGQLPEAELVELQQTQNLSPIKVDALVLPNYIGERHLLTFKSIETSSL